MLQYLALEFPRRIALGAVRSPGWSSTLVETKDGSAYVNQNWANARHDYDLSLAIRTASDYQAVSEHFYQARGKGNCFPFSDPLDNACTVANGTTVLISGADYQLMKRYGSSNPWLRAITLPINGTCTFYRLRGGVRSVIVPAVNFETGVITVSDHEDGDTYQWAGKFFVPVQYAEDRLPAMTEDKQPGPDGQLLVKVDSLTLVEARRYSGANSGSYVFLRGKKLMQPDGPLHFGQAVALSTDGKTLAVGTYGLTDGGGVYVYTLNNQAWQLQQFINGSDSASTDVFGVGVSLSGDGETLAVGASNDTNSGGTSAGSVYIFTRTGEVWTQQHRLQSSDAAFADRFGFGLALSADGGTLAIGAPFDDNSGGSNAGSVYVFIRESGSWTQQQRLQASDASADAFFGDASIALSADGNTLACLSHPGNAGYIFTRSAGVWSEQQILPTSSHMNSVALDSGGDMLVLGHEDDTEVYTRSGSVWSLMQALGERAYAVALNAYADTIVIGDDGADTAYGLNAGIAHVFLLQAGTWGALPDIEDTDGQGGDQLGFSVAVSADGLTIAAGAFGDALDEAHANAGSVQVVPRPIFDTTAAPPSRELPRRIAMGAVRTPTWSTTMAETAGGWATATENWEQARHEYDIGLAVRTADDYLAVLDHFHDMRARVHPFPFKDALDYQATTDNGVLELISGSKYQLHKRYGSINTYDRKITKPVSPCRIYRTRSGEQTLIGAGINFDTGEVLISGHDEGDTYQWAGEFRVPVRYASDKMPAVVVNRRPNGGRLLVQCDDITLVEDGSTSDGSTFIAESVFHVSGSSTALAVGDFTTPDMPGDSPVSAEPYIVDTFTAPDGTDPTARDLDVFPAIDGMNRWIAVGGSNGQIISNRLVNSTDGYWEIDLQGSDTETFLSTYPYFLMASLDASSAPLGNCGFTVYGDGASDAGFGYESPSTRLFAFADGESGAGYFYSDLLFPAAAHIFGLHVTESEVTFIIDGVAIDSAATSMVGIDGKYLSLYLVPGVGGTLACDQVALYKGISLDTALALTAP